MLFSRLIYFSSCIILLALLAPVFRLGPVSVPEFVYHPALAAPASHALAVIDHSSESVEMAVGVVCQSPSVFSDTLVQDQPLLNLNQDASCFGLSLGVVQVATIVRVGGSLDRREVAVVTHPVFQPPVALARSHDTDMVVSLPLLASFVESSDALDSLMRKVAQVSLVKSISKSTKTIAQLNMWRC